MYEENRKEAAEIKKLPIELLEYLPAKRWRGSLGALIALFIVLSVFLSIFLSLMINQNIRYGRSVTELNKNEGLWNSQGISNYEYTLEGWAWLDEGLQHSKIEVTVKDGVAISKQLEFSQGVPGAGELQFDNVDAVPKLFEEARMTLLKAKGLSMPSFSAMVSYDPEFSYPRSISFGSADLLGRAGEYGYQASFLRVLPYPQPAQ